MVVCFWQTLHLLTSIDIRLATAARSHHGSPSRLLLLCSRKLSEGESVLLFWLRTMIALQQARQAQSNSMARRAWAIIAAAVCCCFAALCSLSVPC